MTDIIGTNGDDVIIGTADDDTITTLNGFDIVAAGAGDDTIIASIFGSGSIDGQGGFDTVQIVEGFLSFDFFGNQDTAPDITISTFSGTYDLSRVERVEVLDGGGGLFELLLIGNNGNESFDLTNDVFLNATVFGGGGSDVVTLGTNVNHITAYLGNGNDVFNGGRGFGDVFLGNGNDIFNGEDGAYTVFSGLGADTIDGGNGRSEVWYRDSLEGVSINLDTGVNTGGDAEGDTLKNVDVWGTAFDDVLIGDANDDVFWGGFDGNDIINGGAGDDFIFVSGGTQILTGGDGADIFNYFSPRITGSLNSEITDIEVADTIFLGQIFFSNTGTFGVPIFIGEAAFSGDLGQVRFEVLAGETFIQFDLDGDAVADQELTISNGEFNIVGSDVGLRLELTIASPINGTVIADELFGTRFDDILVGGAGDDEILAGYRDDVLNGGLGDDVLYGQNGMDTINGGDGNDTGFGGNGDDTLNGEAGDDILNGQSGNDTLTGGAGNDTLNGGAGDDIFAGGLGIDTINGGGGDDEMNGGDGDDLLSGSRGEDLIIGGNGDDTIFGNNQNDTLSGNEGLDTLYGGAGNDMLDGGGGNDALVGGAGRDVLFGQAGDDDLNGSAGGDDLFGGGGNDVLNGGGGNDDLYGGSGADIFVFALSGGVDRIHDFEDGVDLIDLSGNSLADNFADVLAVASQNGSNVRIELNANNVLVLEDFVLSDLDADDFIF